MRSRLWLAVIVALFCFVSTPAYATERQIDRPEIETQYEDSTLEVTRAAPTAISKIREVLTFRVNIYGVNRLWYSDRILYGLILGRGTVSGSYFLGFVAIVFGWWGVRKVIRMLFRAFRKGKMNA